MPRERTYLTAGSEETIKAYAAWGAVCLFWGTTYLAIRIGVRTLPPALFAGIRFFMAGSVFLAYLRIRGVALPGKRDLLHIAIVGILLLVIANGCVVWAEQWVPSGLAALIVATLPFWVSGIEAIWPSGNRLNLFKILGIVIGFFGLVVLAPLVKSTFNLPTGQIALTGALLLALMAIPTMVSISEDALRSVPRSYKEVSLAIGASKLQTILRVTIPAALPGIIAAVMLGMGRVIGETMAVIMVTGNSAIITASPFESVRTMTATIAAEMGEVPFGSLHYRALFVVGFVLLVATFILNMVAQRVLKKYRMA
jgi:ABC-type uncharacterized transport system permease subunit